MKRFDPKQSAYNEEKNIFVDICIHILIVKPNGIIAVGTLDKESIIPVLSQVNDQPRHVDKQNHSVKHIFKLEILHDPLVASCVHRHVELLEDKHPLEVKNDDEDVCTPVESLYMETPVVSILLLKSKLVGIELRKSRWILFNSKTIVDEVLVFLQEQGH